MGTFKVAAYAWWGIAVLVLGIGLLAAWQFASRPQPAPLLPPPPATAADEPPADPRRSQSIPFDNVRPEVRYVGDAACAACHPEQAATYRQHPMGRSAAAAVSLLDQERYDSQARNPFTALGWQFQVKRRGLKLIHRALFRDADGQTVAERVAEIAFAIGSGKQGRSYLEWRDGYLYQSPISWYSREHIWDLSPGFDARWQHFSRPITVQCLFCHCNAAPLVEHTINRYEPALLNNLTIGCERCHGPGELHVQRHERGEVVVGPDRSIANPARLEPALREAVCQQCHLLGESRVVRRGREPFDFRPGLPLHLFVSVFVRPAEWCDDQKSVSHVEQMQRSRCFQESKGPGQLGCTSCHDPHAVPAPSERVSFYRERCLRCHAAEPTPGRGRTCVLDPAVRRQQAAGDSCIDCHMPRQASANIAHAAVTDHRIVRRPADPSSLNDKDQELPPGRIPLVHFHRSAFSPWDPEVQRDLGLAMIELARHTHHDPSRRMICATALPLLETALAHAADDLAAAEAGAYALWGLDRPAEALRILEAVLARGPRQLALEDAARIALELEQFEAAQGYWQRLLDANPGHPSGHAHLAELLAKNGHWQLALKACQAALRLDPGPGPARRLLILCCLRTGDKEQARRELDLLERLAPAQADELRRELGRELP